MHGIPSLWQTVIFRNYGTVSNEKLAKVLNTTPKTVEIAASRLGLAAISRSDEWTEKGFVTVIRNNWDLLNNEDIAYLIGKTNEEFEKLLVEFDFLNVKLGDKPIIGKYEYYPLSKEQENITDEIGAYIKKIAKTPEVKPFDFYKNFVTPYFKKSDEYSVKERFLAPYSANYGDALKDDELNDYTDETLARIASVGATGIWLHESLKNLAKFPFDESLSQGYEKRVKNLKRLTEKCDKYGLGVYIYLNEPRSLKPEFFDRYPELKGQKTDEGEYCLCTSVQAVKDYLYAAVKSLAEAVPKLKGVMTITMSENSTHCYSRVWRGVKNHTDCPHCKNRRPEEVAAEVNNIMARALSDGNGYTKLIANLWGWSAFMGWNDDMTLNGIRLLDWQISVLSVSEYSKKFERGGVKGEVVDYSISVVGPSDLTVKSLKLAKQLGHDTFAKIQVNNSWECSGVPYIPAFGLMKKHVDNLKETGVSGLMLGWSLGGYTGGALPLVNMDCGKNFDETEWYKMTYGKDFAAVKRAVEIFDEAFSEYPFSVDALYFGGQNLACGNFWSRKPVERKSTMVCFTFDDYENYVMPYGVDIYVSQMEKLLTRWQAGIIALSEIDGNAATEELKRMAKGVYIHLSSATNLALFTREKRSGFKNEDLVKRLIESERTLTLDLYGLICQDAKIGYEMTNHYFYNANLLLEKLLNLKYLV